MAAGGSGLLGAVADLVRVPREAVGRVPFRTVAATVPRCRYCEQVLFS